MFYPKLSDVRDIWIRNDSYSVASFPLNGVTSLNFDNSTPRREVNILGQPTSNIIMDGPFNYGVSLSRNLFGPDLFWGWTGVNQLRFQIAFDTDRTGGGAINPYKTYGMVSLQGGYMDSYSVDVSAGGIPQIQSSFRFDNGTGFYDMLTGWRSALGDATDSTPQYIPQTGIVLNLGGIDSGQVVTSANFAAKFNWVKEPVMVKDLNDTTNRGNYFISSLVRPIQYSASIQMTIDDYEVGEFAFRNPQTWELSVTCETGLIATYTMPNAELVDESVNITAGQPSTVSLGYIGVG